MNFKTFVIVLATLSTVNLFSQTGNWDVNSGNVTTTTLRDVGIGTISPAGKTEIEYCNLPPQNGLIVTLVDCNNSGIVGIDENGSGGTYSGNGGGSSGGAPIVNFSAINFSPTYQLTTQILPLINSNQSPMFWLRQEFPANSASNPNVFDEYKTRFIVQPNGLVGINTANPRAILDVVSNNPASTEQPTAIFAKNVPGQVLNANGQTGYYTTQIMINNKLKSGQYNSIVQENDQAILFSDGMSTTLNGSNSNGALVIAPYASTSSVGGMRMDANGNLELRGNFKSLKSTVAAKWWSDFVFDSNYNLLSLDSLENYIKKNKHLPYMPSESEIKNEGIDVSVMFALQQQKIEELILYLIEQNKLILSQSIKLKELENKN